MHYRKLYFIGFVLPFLLFISPVFPQIGESNEYALNQYERFVTNYCGRRVGMRTHAQKSYTGKISDIYLYELTRKDYFAWKARRWEEAGGT
jgi:hypothetical protein